ncbi:MAG: hypothetical protein V1894_01340 [Chloroflexota bacterium]
MLNIKAKHVVNKIVWDEKNTGELHKAEDEDVTIIEFFQDADGNPNFLYIGEDRHFYTDNIKYFHFVGGTSRRKAPAEKG